MSKFITATQDDIRPGAVFYRTAGITMYLCPKTIGFGGIRPDVEISCYDGAPIKITVLEIACVDDGLPGVAHHQTKLARVIKLLAVDNNNVTTIGYVFETILLLALFKLEK